MSCAYLQTNCPFLSSSVRQLMVGIWIEVPSVRRGKKYENFNPCVISHRSSYTGGLGSTGSSPQAMVEDGE